MSGISSIFRDWGNDAPAIVRITTSDNLVTAGAAGYIAAQASNITIANQGIFTWIPSDNILISCSDGTLFGQITSDFSSITIIGATNDGALITSTVLHSAPVSCPFNTNTNITSILVPAGDWDISGNIFLDNNSAVIQNAYGWMSTVSATIPDLSKVNGFLFSSHTMEQFGMAIASQPFNFTVPTIVYLSTQVGTFDSSATPASGFISARLNKLI